jgi:hypothetical protein
MSRITGASVDWAFESSDHVSVKIDFTFEEEPIRGPGIVKVNTNIQRYWMTCLLLSR